MADFTKGKWRAVYYTPKYIAINGGIYLISSSSGDSLAVIPRLADARLIVKAPDMYRLLNKAFQVLGENNLDEPLRLEINECLCRIEGVKVPGDDDKESKP